MSTTSGYSGTPLARKLGIGGGARVAVLSPPEGFDSTSVPCPPACRCTPKRGAAAT